MNYKGINLRKIDPKALLNDLSNGCLGTISNSDVKDLMELIEQSVDKGIYWAALNSVLIGIKIGYNKTFSTIRKKGLFRYSKYYQKKCIIGDISNGLLLLDKEFNFLDDKERKYLQSIANLIGLSSSFVAIHRLIIEEIKRFSKNHKKQSLIKTLLAFSDFLFLTNYVPEDPTNRLSVKSRTKEEIAEAVSYLIFFISSLQEVKAQDTVFVADEYITSGEIGRIILPVCTMIELKEIEILIESFDYTCLPNEEKLKITPPSEDFDKSIRLGYIRSELQIGSYVDEALHLDIIDGAASMESLIDTILDGIGEHIKFYHKEDFGYGRYVLEFPEHIIDILAERIFKPNTFFKEDLMYLSVIFKQQLLTIDDLENTIIRDNLTINEFMNIRRLFSFLLSLYQKNLYKNKDTISTGLLVRSIIPAYHEDQFYELFGRITSQEKLDTFLDIMCWEQGFENMFDLQYNPLLYIDGLFLIPLNIFSTSNAIRNLYASEHKNQGLLINAGLEPLSENLYNSFNKAGTPCLKNVNFLNGDVDVLAIVDNALYIFECKHTLHPINVYDMRTTFDHIQKAELQLEKIKKEYDSGSLKRIIEDRLGISLEYVDKVSYSIILSNKLFSGNTQKYPIRHINELINIIEEGRFKTNDGIYLVWQGDNMTSQDLDNFLGTHNAALNILYESLSVATLSYPLTIPSIEMDWHYLESEILLPKVKAYTDSLRRME
jgi:hypothetical protein